MKGERRTVTAVRLPTMPTLHTRGSSVSLGDTVTSQHTQYPAIIKRYEASQPQLVICPTDCTWLEASIL